MLMGTIAYDTSYCAVAIPFAMVVSVAGSVVALRSKKTTTTNQFLRRLQHPRHEWNCSA